MKEWKRRFVGIDLGKREYTMAIIRTNGKMSYRSMYGVNFERKAKKYRTARKSEKSKILNTFIGQT